MTTTPNIPELIVQLKAQLEALAAVDVNDLPTENQQIAHRRRYNTIQGHVSALMNLPQDLQDEQAALDVWLANSAAYVAKQDELDAAIAAAPDVTLITDDRARGIETQHQWTLRRQRQMLEDGTLLVAGGVSLGVLSHIDARIEELTRRRDRVQNALDAHSKAAEELLTVAAS